MVGKRELTYGLLIVIHWQDAAISNELIRYKRGCKGVRNTAKDKTRQTKTVIIRI